MVESQRRWGERKPLVTPHGFHQSLELGKQRVLAQEIGRLTERYDDLSAECPTTRADRDTTRHIGGEFCLDLVVMHAVDLRQHRTDRRIPEQLITIPRHPPLPACSLDHQGCAEFS